MQEAREDEGAWVAHRTLLPIADDQAAWTADVIAGRIAMPSSDIRAEAAARAAERRHKDFGDSHPFLVDYPTTGPSFERTADGCGGRRLSAGAALPRPYI